MRVRNWSAASNPRGSTALSRKPPGVTGQRLSHPLAPVLEQIRHRLLEWDRRLPASRGFEFVDVCPQQAHIARSHARWVLFNRDLGRRVAQQGLEHVTYAHATPAAYVVNLAGGALLGGQPV